MKPHYLGASIRAVIALGLSLATAHVLAQAAAGRTLYVSATGSAQGDGSLAKPYGNLAQVESASLPGDTIIVLAVDDSTPPLDGGIALKPGQKLLGRGATSDPTTLPRLSARITNTSATHLQGDAVQLAPQSEVAGLSIVTPYRGGIYGLDADGAYVHDNDISGHNTSCTLGIIIPPAVLPTTIANLIAPNPVPLPNGWAGIMLDAQAGNGHYRVHGNVVHDAGCGDGIDVRTQGTASYQVEIDDNHVFNLQQGPLLRLHLSILAIGFQASDRSSLVATLDGNVEHDIGGGAQLNPSGADSEGLFFNTLNQGQIQADVGHNQFYRGIGGASANGMEQVAMGDGGRIDLHIADSSFTDVESDVLEQFAFGTHGVLSLSLDRVSATHSNGSSLLQGIEGLLGGGNGGDCLSVNSTGSANTLNLSIHDSVLAHCVRDGVSIHANSLLGSAPTQQISFDIARSRIGGNQGDGLRLQNQVAVNQLSGRVELSDISGNGGANIFVSNSPGAQLGSVVLDFGGGPLGSAGGNCIYGGKVADAVDQGYDVYLRNNWWGASAGPNWLGRISQTLDGKVDITPVLPSVSACGPDPAVIVPGIAS